MIQDPGAGMSPASPRRGRSSALTATATVVVAVAALLAGCSGPPSAPALAPPAALVARTPAGHGPQTIVSLTFDDGSWTQYQIFPQMIDHGLRGTFYVNTGLMDRGDSSVMTWDELRRLAVAGNDIGGHTLDHVDLPTLPDTQKQTEVCRDRDRLVAQGFDPVSFAYPFGDHDPASEAVVRSCGYRTARVTGGLNSSRPTENMPPADPYTISSITGGEDPTKPVNSNGPLTMDFLQSSVRAAAAQGGGWVPLVFHMICRSSSPDYQRCMASDGPVDYAVVSDFLDWLDTGAPPGTVVKTVNEMTAQP